jgi:hypothetical protein
MQPRALRRRPIIECWNEQLVASRDILWSPTIRAALIAGTPWLDVFCPGLRHQPGNSSAEGRPSSPPVGCHPCARAAVLVVPGIRSHSRLVRDAAGNAYAEDSSGLHALPPAARAAASKLDFRPAD